MLRIEKGQRFSEAGQRMVLGHRYHRTAHSLPWAFKAACASIIVSLAIACGDSSSTRPGEMTSIDGFSMESEGLGVFSYRRSSGAEPDTLVLPDDSDILVQLTWLGPAGETQVDASTHDVTVGLAGATLGSFEPANEEFGGTFHTVNLIASAVTGTFRVRLIRESDGTDAFDSGHLPIRVEAQ